MATIDYGKFDIGATRKFSTNGATSAAFNRGQTFEAECTFAKTVARFKYVFTKKTVPKGAVVAYSSPGVVGIGATAGASRRRAGCACSLISASTYGFVQINGANVYRVKTGTAVAAGDTCIKNTGTAHKLVTAAATGSQFGMIVGYALADDSGSYMAPGKFMIQCPD